MIEILFYTFSSQEERRSFGGSAFIEIQFCKHPMGTNVEKIVNDIDHWKNDSLYILDENSFYKEYCHIFDCGTYNNLKTGTVDIYGINYYTPSLTDFIIERLNKKRPSDFEALTEWLIKSKSHNGFYIFGI